MSATWECPRCGTIYSLLFKRLEALEERLREVTTWQVNHRGIQADLEREKKFTSELMDNFRELEREIDAFKDEPNPVGGNVSYEYQDTPASESTCKPTPGTIEIAPLTCHRCGTDILDGEYGWIVVKFAVRDHSVRTLLCPDCLFAITGIDRQSGEPVYGTFGDLAARIAADGERAMEASESTGGTTQPEIKFCESCGSALGIEEDADV